MRPVFPIRAAISPGRNTRRASRRLSRKRAREGSEPPIPCALQVHSDAETDSSATPRSQTAHPHAPTFQTKTCALYEEIADTMVRDKARLADAPPSGDITYVLPSAQSAIALAVALDQEAAERYIAKDDMWAFNECHRKSYHVIKDASIAIQEYLEARGREVATPYPNFEYREETRTRDMVRRQPSGRFDLQPVPGGLYAGTRLAQEELPCAGELGPHRGGRSTPAPPQGADQGLGQPDVGVHHRGNDAGGDDGFRSGPSILIADENHEESNSRTDRKDR